MFTTCGWRSPEVLVRHPEKFGDHSLYPVGASSAVDNRCYGLGGKVESTSNLNLCNAPFNQKGFYLLSVHSCHSCPPSSYIYDKRQKMSRGFLMNDSVASRLKYVKQKLNLTGKMIAHACGVHPSTVDNYLNGKRHADAPFLQRFCWTYGVNPNWLLLGEGIPFRDEEEFTYVARVDVRLGAGGEAEVFDAEPKEVYAFRRDWLLQRGNPKDMRLAKVMGDSMEPTLKEGDLVLVDLSQKEIIQGQIYAVRLFNGLLIKRLQRLDQNRVRLISDNQVHPPEERSLDSGEFEIIGRVLWVGRNL